MNSKEQKAPSKRKTSRVRTDIFYNSCLNSNFTLSTKELIFISVIVLLVLYASYLFGKHIALQAI